jgi:PPE-repeat protein
MSFMTLPPEVNSWLMFSGAGLGPNVGRSGGLGRVGR